MRSATPACFSAETVSPPPPIDFSPADWVSAATDWAMATVAVSTGGVVHLRLLQRLADRMALRREEGVGHGAADDQHVHLAGQVAQQVQLGADLGAADDGDD